MSGYDDEYQKTMAALRGPVMSERQILIRIWWIVFLSAFIVQPLLALGVVLALTN